MFIKLLKINSFHASKEARSAEEAIEEMDQSIYYRVEGASEKSKSNDSIRQNRIRVV